MVVNFRNKERTLYNLVNDKSKSIKNSYFPFVFTILFMKFLEYLKQLR